MKRLVIMTVGKTHSGKTTFARALEKELDNSFVMKHNDEVDSVIKRIVEISKVL